MVLRNATKLETWKSRLNFKKNICDQKAPDGEVGGPKSLHIQDLRIHGSNIGQIRFSLWSFSFWPRSDFHQKRLKSEKSNPIFYLKGRRDMSWFFNFWIAQWLHSFLQNSFFFLFRPSSSGGKGVKVGAKVQTLGISRFWKNFSWKNFSFSKILKALLLFPWMLTVMKMLAKSGKFGSVRAQKGPFHGCWIGTKNLENL